MKCVCGRLVWCVLYSQLREEALLQWFEWFCPLCLTVAKAFGCRIKSPTIAHLLGREKYAFFRIPDWFYPKGLTWIWHRMRSLMTYLCFSNGVSHTQHLLQVLLAIQTLQEGCGDPSLAGSPSGSFAPVLVVQGIVDSSGTHRIF